MLAIKTHGRGRVGFVQTPVRVNKTSPSVTLIAPTLTNPTVISISETSEIITWTTDVPSDSQVDYTPA